MTTNAARLSDFKWPLRMVAAALVVAIFLIPGGEHLLLGWLYFPLRTVPQISVDIPAAILGLLSFVAFIVGFHVLLRRFAASASNHSWPWSATLATSLIFILMFVAGTAMVGATHQVMWLFAGRSTPSTVPAQTVIGITDATRQSDQMMKQSHNAKHIAMNIQNFHDSYRALPPGGTMTEDGELLHGWGILGATFTMFYTEDLDFSVPWNKPPNDRIYKCNLWLFANPAIRGPYFDKDGFGLSHFSGNVHVLPIRTVKPAEFDADDRSYGPMRQLSKTNQTINVSQITDGASNTLLIGTVSERFKPWGHPANVRDPALGVDRSPDGFGGPPSWNGAIFSFCDGHTALINKKIDPRVFRQLATPSGGEPPLAGY